jgi:dTDP-4-dehydrorhamnose 3,5-epimerase
MGTDAGPSMSAGGIDAWPTAVQGCLELRLRLLADARGSFVKLYQTTAFAELGLDLGVEELFVSRSHRGVVRGLHFQRPPADVAKLVCCLDGAVTDAVVDLRSDSPTYGQHCTIELSSDRGNAVYVPEGCAHGFLVTSDSALVAYAQTGEHSAELEGGILWSSAGIDWGDIDADQVTLSDRDAGFPALADFARSSPFRLPPSS